MAWFQLTRQFSGKNALFYEIFYKKGIFSEESLYFYVWVFFLNTCLDDDLIGIMMIPFRWSLFAQLNGKLKQKMYVGSLVKYFWLFLTVLFIINL